MRRLLVFLSITTILALVPTCALGAPHTAKVLPPTAAPFGHTYGEWAALWWQWALGQPASTNPILDTTGASCADGQQGHVWFLAGSFGSDPVERSCTVRAGTALVFPVLNNGSFAFETDPPDQRTEEFVRAQAEAAFPATDLHASIDGVDLGFEELERYYETSALFSVTLGPDNLFGLPEGFLLDPCADAGYYVAVPPLSPGEHTITFGGTNAFGFSIDVTYHLTVVT